MYLPFGGQDYHTTLGVTGHLRTQSPISSSVTEAHIPAEALSCLVAVFSPTSWTGRPIGLSSRFTDKQTEPQTGR